LPSYCGYGQIVLAVAIFETEIVSRIDASSENYSTSLTLDVNTEIYPLRENDRIELLLATQLDSNASEEILDGYDASRKLQGRAAAYEYIMHGKIFKYAESHGKAIVYASYGGLLMSLKGEPRTLGPRAFNVDSRLYLFLKKVQDI
jgi:DNA-directed RNA polymerases I, II, and III subunit RPABC3